MYTMNDGEWLQRNILGGGDTRVMQKGVCYGRNLWRKCAVYPSVFRIYSWASLIVEPLKIK